MNPAARSVTALIEAIISNPALSSVNLSQLNVTICFELNTVAPTNCLINFQAMKWIQAETITSS